MKLIITQQDFFILSLVRGEPALVGYRIHKRLNLNLSATYKSLTRLCNWGFLIRTQPAQLQPNMPVTDASRSYTITELGITATQVYNNAVQHKSSIDKRQEPNHAGQ